MRLPRNPLLAEIARRPMLRPHVVADPDPVLVYTDHQGRHHALALTHVDLAHLGLSIAVVQGAAHARAAGNSRGPGTSANLTDSNTDAGGGCP